MHDIRMKKLADVLVGHSTKVQPGEKVLINASEIPIEMVLVLMDRIVEAGGLPFVQINNPRVMRSIYLNGNEEQGRVIGQHELEFMKQMQCYIALYGDSNSMEMSDVPEDKMKIVQKWRRAVQEYRVNNSKWVCLAWPTPSMAQSAGMSTESFENFYFNVCTLDYERMEVAMEPLKERLERADRVRVLGPLDTDVEFSIKGLPAVICAGSRNIPDGELFTAPLRQSVNGVIHFNATMLNHGKAFDDVRFVYKAGKIVEVAASDSEALSTILDCDEGARYIGEFSFGLNPYITKPMRDVLFDEKIAGSLHFAAGNGCNTADNGNRSVIHWDMVLLQTEEHGGGEVYLDGELIRKNGRFVPDYLQGLNPENLA